MMATMRITPAIRQVGGDYCAGCLTGDWCAGFLTGERRRIANPSYKRSGDDPWRAGW